MTNNRRLREESIFLFHSNKTPAKAHRELRKVYNDAAVSETTYRYWFRCFKDGDFDVGDCWHEGNLKTFDWRHYSMRIHAKWKKSLLQP